MNILRWAAFFGFSGVILGAFGAHGLESALSAEKINSFETGVRYQFWHALALLALYFLSKNIMATKWIFYCWIIGVCLFSGSIYLLATQELLNVSLKWLWPVTPIGGLFLITGWGILLIKSITTSKAA